MVVVVVLHVAVVLAPAAILALAADKGGIPDHDGAVLLAASGVVGLLLGGVAAAQLQTSGADLPDALLASFNALVVLALGSTGLLFLALGAYEPLAPVLVNRGWPVVVTWVLAQLLAGGLAELTRVGVRRWLVGDRPAAGAREHTP